MALLVSLLVGHGSRRQFAGVEYPQGTEDDGRGLLHLRLDEQRPPLMNDRVASGAEGGEVRSILVAASFVRPVMSLEIAGCVTDGAATLRVRH
jgi:hypothetical protein